MVEIIDLEAQITPIAKSEPYTTSTITHTEIYLNGTSPDSRRPQKRAVLAFHQNFLIDFFFFLINILFFSLLRFKAS